MMPLGEHVIGGGFVEARAAGAFMPGFASQPLTTSRLQHQASSFDTIPSSLALSPPATPVLERGLSQPQFSPPASVVKALENFHLSTPKAVATERPVDLRTPETPDNQEVRELYHGPMPPLNQDSQQTLKDPATPGSEETSEVTTHVEGAGPTEVHGKSSTDSMAAVDKTAESSQKQSDVVSPVAPSPTNTVQPDPPVAKETQDTPMEQVSGKKEPSNAGSPSAEQPKEPAETKKLNQDEQSVKPADTATAPAPSNLDQKVEKPVTLPPATGNSRKEMYEDGSYWRPLIVSCCTFLVLTG